MLREANGLREGILSPMSAENVELVRRIYAWMAAGEAERSFAVYDEAIEWDLTRAPFVLQLGFEAVSRGHDAIRAGMRAWLEAWDRIEYVLDDLIDAGDRVLALVHLRASGRASRVPVSYDHPMLWTVRDGMVTRVQVFGDRAEALQAAGLSPES
jgi:ketosteroid isomerase-like protein